MDLTTTVTKIKEGFLGQSTQIISPKKQQQMASHPFAGELYATAIGYYPLASYHDRERFNGSGDFILVYCIDGHGYVEEAGHKTYLNPNSFYILSKNSPHHYGSIPKKPWSIYWLHFNGKKAELLYQRYIESGKPNVLPYEKLRIERFNYLIKTLNEELTDMVMDLLYINLLDFVTSFTHIKGKTEEIPDDCIAQTIRFMKEHVNETFQIKDFATRANYSVTRFSQLFRTRTGYAPMQYFLHLKIQHASQYLSFSKMNVKEIAQVLGFNDPYYFSRIFKIVTGSSPLSYRKINRER